jgi:hypothetical protein
MGRSFNFAFRIDSYLPIILRVKSLDGQKNRPKKSLSPGGYLNRRLPIYVTQEFVLALFYSIQGFQIRKNIG